MHNVDEPELNLPDWEKLHRLVPSHFPVVDLFENVASPDELEIVFEIESLTNDRLRDEVGDLTLVPAEERISGPGSTPVMAAFTHLSLLSRFTDGTQYGVYYGAKELDTAIAETIYHRERFLSATNEPDTEITMRCYINKVALTLHDVRPDMFVHLHGEDYAEPQRFAKELRDKGSNGLVYNSVRHAGGECIAAFKPRTVTIPIQAGHYRYVWCGRKQKITNVLSVSEIK